MATLCRSFSSAAPLDHTYDFSFSERELCSLYAVARPSVVCNVRAPYPLQAVEIFDNVSTPFVPWPSVDIHVKFYGDRLRRTYPSTRNVSLCPPRP